VELDSGTKAKLRLLYPDFSVRIIRTYLDMFEQHGIQMRMTEGLRTFARQEELYAQGRTTPGQVVTWARPGYSLHHYGVACDSCRTGKDPWDVPWDKFAEAARSHGLYAGFYWKKQDRPHLELGYGGMGVEQMLKLYQNKGLESVWAEFDTIRGVTQGSEWYGPQKKIKIMNVGEI
jgi:peptidoglycan L-alanyl-D-glutamate endopeptidase CwlK